MYLVNGDLIILLISELGEFRVCLKWILEFYGGCKIWEEEKWLLFVRLLII